MGRNVLAPSFEALIGARAAGVRGSPGKSVARADDFRWSGSLTRARSQADGTTSFPFIDLSESGYLNLLVCILLLSGLLTSSCRDARHPEVGISDIRISGRIPYPRGTKSS